MIINSVRINNFNESTTLNMYIISYFFLSIPNRKMPGHSVGISLQNKIRNLDEYSLIYRYSHRGMSDVLEHPSKCYKWGPTIQCCFFHIRKNKMFVQKCLMTAIINWKSTNYTWLKISEKNIRDSRKMYLLGLIYHNIKLKIKYMFV
jgi:hypothetical protein